MIKLTKEQKEKIKELKRIEEEHAGEGEYRRSQDSENEDFDNEEEKYDGYDESNEYYDEPDPYDDYEQELINNEDDDDDSDSNIDYYADIAVQALNEEERKEREEEETELRNEWIKCEKEKRARIAFEKQDGSIISSVVEKWGEQLRWTLIEHFNDEKFALKVSEVGSIDHKEEDCSALQQTIKKLIQDKNNNKTKELQAFENFDEYDKYIKDARDIDCAYLWRNKSWEFLDWIFEHDPNDDGIDITIDNYLPTLFLSSTSLKKEKDESKFIKNFTFQGSGNWESIPDNFEGSSF